MPGGPRGGWGPGARGPGPRRGRWLAALGVGLALLAGGAAGKDLYQVLGLSRGAAEAQIKRAYRKLAVKYHPDKNKGDQTAADKFAEIGNAYEVLSDPEKKKIYDRYGMDGLKQHQQQGGGGGAQDIFSQMFGGFGFGGRQEQEPETPKNTAVQIDLEVSLRDLYQGVEIPFEVTRATLEKAPGQRKCNCKMRMVTQQLGPGMFQQYQKEECEKCDNVRWGSEQSTLNAVVEPGMKDGQTLLFFEEGDAMVDGDPADLVLVIKTTSPAGEAQWERRGDDLWYTAEIGLKEALLGFQKEITHFDGRKVPHGSAAVLQYGHVRKLPGEGMPKYDGSGKGDLYVKYLVKFPEKLSKQQLAAVQAL